MKVVDFLVYIVNGTVEMDITFPHLVVKRDDLKSTLSSHPTAFDSIVIVSSEFNYAYGRDTGLKAKSVRNH